MLLICAVAYIACCAVGLKSVNVGLHIKEQVAISGNICQCYDQRYDDCFKDSELTYLDSSFSCRQLGDIEAAAQDAAARHFCSFQPTCIVTAFLSKKLLINR